MARPKRKRTSIDTSSQAAAGAPRRRRESIGPESATSTTTTASPTPDEQKQEPNQPQQPNRNEGNDQAEPGPSMKVPQQEKLEKSEEKQKEITAAAAAAANTGNAASTSGNKSTSNAATVPATSTNLPTSASTSVTAATSGAIPSQVQMQTQPPASTSQQPAQSKESTPPDASTATMTSPNQTLRHLQHRKILLKRLQQARAACQTRLHKLPPTTLSDEQEVIAFRESSRQATSIARRLSSAAFKDGSSQAGQQPHPSVSLRRGSSVGKRMNQALHTLSSPMSASSLAVAQQGGSRGGGISSSTGGGVTGTAGQKIKKLPSSKRASSVPTVPTSRGRGQILSTTSMAKATGPTGKIMHGSKNGSSNSKTVMRRPLSTETAILRERKRQLEQKLSIETHRRKRHAIQKRLPPRRKTHWDVLLQEMRWMATDFREERKWKKAAARILVSEEGIVAAIKTKTIANLKAASPGVKSSKMEATMIPVESQNPAMEVEDEKKAVSLANEQPRRAYTPVSDIDKEIALQIAGRLSESLMEHVVNLCGTSKDAAKEFNCVNKEAASDIGKNDAGTSSDENVIPSVTGAYSGVASTKLTTVDKRELFQEISDRVQAVAQYSVNVSSNNGDKHSTILQAMGKCKDEAVGYVLQGTHACGKTVFACTWLHQNRMKGPQLVLCPATRLVRWGYEIDQFEDLNVKIMGKDFDDSSAELGSSDVLLCDLLSLPRLEKHQGVQSVVVDCRHPSAFYGSRQPTCVQPTEHSTPQQQVLGSATWWSGLANFVKAKRRLILENMTAAELQEDTRAPPSYILENKPEKRKEILEVLAFRTCFLLGGSGGNGLLVKSPKTTSRALLSWARRRALSRATKLDKKPQLFCAVQEVLIAAVESLHICLDTKHRLDQSILWDIRLCEMTQQQEDAYNKCCHQVQPTLSRGLVGQRADQPSLVSHAMFRLRKHCSHADLSGYVSSKIPLLATQLYTANPSQSSYSDVKDILEGSGKLQTLASFLVHDCRLAALEEPLADLVPQSPVKMIKRKRASQQLQKIAVLSALPELQIMTSLLLYSLGIDHCLLLPPMEHESTEESAFRTWMEHQKVLSDFNKETEEDYQLIVSSLDILGSDHGGLGIESADVVICLDEDWSGRSELLLYSLLARSSLRREQDEENPCKFVRLVAANSCEMVFLKSPKSKSKTPPMEKLPLALNPMGWFEAGPMQLGTGQKKHIREYWRKGKGETPNFAFPAHNLLSIRDHELATVLAIDEFPSLLAIEDDPLFLPLRSGEDSFESELEFISALMKKEMETRQCFFREVEAYFDLLLVSDSERAPSREILFQRKVSSFLRKFAYVVDSSSFGGSLEKLNLSLPLGLVSTAMVLSKEQGSTSDSAQPAGTIEDHPSSLLFYSARESRKRRKNTKKPAGKETATCRRNLFASTFGGMDIPAALNDGSQGTEPLVYFPPLLPRILESSLLAKTDEALLKSKALHAGTSGEVEKKRPTIDTSSSQAAKRPRPDSLSLPSPNGEPIRSTETKNGPDAKDPPKTEDDPDPLLELQEDYGVAGIGAVPLPRDSALSSAYTSVTTVPVSMGIDPGGHSPFPDACDPEEMERMSRERDECMGSVILFVSRKRPRGYNGRPTSTVQGRASGWNGNSLPAAITSGTNGIRHDSAGATGGKRPKKKLSIQTQGALPSSAFTRFPHVDPVVSSLTGGPTTGGGQGQKSKDLYKKGLLASLRQSAMGSTLFEATAFRSASQRVKNRVESRLIRHCWTSSTTFEVGPGLPLHISKTHSPNPSSRLSFEYNPNLWTSIVKRLKSPGLETGSEALELADKQRTAFHRSLAIPCRVDFGPFQSGFLSAPSGMTSIGPTRFRAGVSLPMGVKISPLVKDQSTPTWDPSISRSLVLGVSRYGKNWALTAMSIRGFEQFRHVIRPGSASLGASRSCHEKWQSMSSDDLSLAENTKLSEVEHRSIFLERRNCFEKGVEGLLKVNASTFGAFDQEAKENDESTHDSCNVIFLVPEDGSDQEATMEVDAGKPKSEQPRKSFAAFRQARTQTIKNDMSIPGVPAGSSPGAGPPSHPSHLEAVQASLAGANSGARQEMWPLQILAANRKRAASGSSSSSGAAQHVRTPAPSVTRPAAKGRTVSASRPSAVAHASSAGTQQRTAAYKKAAPQAKDAVKAKVSPSRSTQPPVVQQHRSAATAQSFAPPPNPIPTTVKKGVPDSVRKPGQ